MSVPNPATVDWVPLYGPSGTAQPDLNYRGAYVAGQYVEGDVVIYQNVAYMCVVDTSEAPTPWPVTGTPVPTPVVNGQWLKGAGGAAVWGPIVPSDIGAAPQNLTGTYLTRPAASSVAAGTIYWATDTLGTWRSDGTTWTLIQQGAPLVSNAQWNAAPFTTPYDFQMVDLADTGGSNGEVWRFRYLAGWPGSYKWTFVGGPPLFSQWKGTHGISSAPVRIGAAGGPVLTVPRAGDYDVAYGSGGQVETASASDVAVGVYNAAGTQLGSNDWQGCMARVNGLYDKWDIESGHRLTALTAGTVLDTRCSVTPAVLLNHMTAFLSLVPVRVA